MSLKVPHTKHQFLVSCNILDWVRRTPLISCERGLNWHASRGMRSVRITFSKVWIDRKCICQVESYTSFPLGRRRPLVAGSLGPYGVYLADGSEYTGSYNSAISDAVLTSCRNLNVSFLCCIIIGISQLSSASDKRSDQWRRWPHCLWHHSYTTWSGFDSRSAKEGISFMQSMAGFLMQGQCRVFWG